MKAKIIFWAFISLVAAYIAVFVWKPERHHPPGQIAPLTPVQEDVSDAKTFEHEGYTFRPLARFAIQARVLGTRTYWFDASSKLSPIDLALGWGPMSDSAVLSKLRITQSRRWYEYWWKDAPPIEPAVIAGHSANMHMIPADKAIRKKLLSVHKGDIVEIVGLLVDIRHENGFKWRSSTSRTDQDGGACEVIFVESILINFFTDGSSFNGLSYKTGVFSHNTPCRSDYSKSDPHIFLQF
ncbi:hypothetical protein QPK87_25665 [Kamptonema cortianum]|nr:hypothetical protein [Oscillatoria laete-virens]MDK3159922.1 hypothetical protein [Kamptonema cortianum]MDL5050509.1 hypothetical protein [Oscillatoria amoena NRMC-F 0135]MDL5055521.1 hypothetical protein [Oscillatoria laete-virens NRMC-F 0139]